MASPSPRTTQTFPRGGAQAGRLHFPRGVAPRVSVRALELPDGLARTSFASPEPRVFSSAGEVVVDYTGFFRWFFAGRAAPGEIALAHDIPWTIAIDGGIASAEMDLRATQLARMDIDGGVARVDIRLGPTSRVVPIRVRGGAARVRITYPAGSSARVRVSGGAAHLVVGDQRLGAVGGPSELETRGWDAASGYDIKIEGGAAHLEIIQEDKP